MAEINERERNNTHTGKAAGSGVGAVPGDTMAAALDPFGSMAGAHTGTALDNKEEETKADHNQRSKT